MKDLTNKKIGKLTIIKAGSIDNNGRFTWICKCECGNTKIIASSSLVQNITKSCGCLKRQNKKWTESDESFLKDNYLEMSSNEMSKYLPYTSGAISAKLKRLGLSKRNFLRKRDYKFFYLLGWIFADGYITNQKIEIKISKNDIEVLEYFKKMYPISKIYIVNDKYAKWVLSNKKICSEIVRDFNIHSPKSNNLIFPNIEDQYIDYFIKGFYEGDGSLYSNGKYKNISIYSNSNNFLKSIKEHLNLFKGTIRCDRGNYILRYGNRDTRLLSQKLYKENCFNLIRKYL